MAAGAYASRAVGMEEGYRRAPATARDGATMLEAPGGAGGAEARSHERDAGRMEEAAARWHPLGGDAEGTARRMEVNGERRETWGKGGEWGACAHP